MLHAKVKAIAFSCSTDKKIFQSVVPICWWERFFANLAMNHMAQKSRLRTHANKLVARGASLAHEIDGFGHEQIEGRSTCCARTTSGYAAASPPSVNITSRRGMWIAMLPLPSRRRRDFMFAEARR